MAFLNFHDTHLCGENVTFYADPLTLAPVVFEGGKSFSCLGEPVFDLWLQVWSLGT